MQSKTGRKFSASRSHMGASGDQESKLGWCRDHWRKRREDGRGVCYEDPKQYYDTTDVYETKRINLKDALLEMFF